MAHGRFDREGLGPIGPDIDFDTLRRREVGRPGSRTISSS
jgi:hypothetical protein